jgi:hypothetical protein
MTPKEIEENQDKVFALVGKFGNSANIRVELDNLDCLKEIRINENDEVLVENEHGTEFELTELSDTEFSVLIFELETQLAERKKVIITSYNTENGVYWRVMDFDTNENIESDFESTADAEEYCFEYEYNPINK